MECSSSPVTFSLLGSFLPPVLAGVLTMVSMVMVILTMFAVVIVILSGKVLRRGVSKS